MTEIRRGMLRDDFEWIHDNRGQEQQTTGSGEKCGRIQQERAVMAGKSTNAAAAGGAKPDETFGHAQIIR